jgi:hypothetical protein
MRRRPYAACDMQEARRVSGQTTLSGDERFATQAHLTGQPAGAQGGTVRGAIRIPRWRHRPGSEPFTSTCLSHSQPGGAKLRALLWRQQALVATDQSVDAGIQIRPQVSLSYKLALLAGEIARVAAH